jgi:hypothetical protein
MAQPASTYAGSGGFKTPQRSRTVNCSGGDSGPSQYRIIRQGWIRPAASPAGTSGEVVAVRPSRIMPRAQSISGQLPLW